MKEECNKELLSDPEEEDNNVVSWRYDDFGETTSDVVGLSRDVDIVYNKLSLPFSTLVLVGMAGIGKTALAKEVFAYISRRLINEYSAWVKVGPKPRLKQILQEKTEEKLAKYLFESLKGTRYLIVLDDVWHGHVIEDLTRIIGYNNRNGRILVTTRLREVASGAYPVHKMRFLNGEESWCLLRDKVFGEESSSCPGELTKVGKKIAENCQGLPVLILEVAKILFKDKKTVEYWNEVAEKRNSVFSDANDRIFEVLFPSYENLPQHLKACFLYMGVFPQDCEIPCSKLIKLWSVEEFLDQPSKFINFKDFGMKCINDLVSGSLVIVHKKSSNDAIKTCSLHCAVWHLCVTEAQRNRFFHILNSRADGLGEGVKSQHRLCVHNNVLCATDTIVNSTARSLLCTGPYYRYPVPICFGLKLLRVLDALSIRLYEFPMEALKLVQLRYLALTYNGDVPRSISQLWNLQFIWDMKELKHLQVVGSDLPEPCNGDVLPNLVTLLDVSVQSCTKGVLEGLPNLEKLGTRIELVLNNYDDFEPSTCFDYVFRIHKLESFECVVLNPKLDNEAIIVPRSLGSHFPESLKRVSLSGVGCPWEDMKAIASLPNLEVLKLRCYAFRGPEWATGEWEFQRLRFLLIEDSDLENWRAPFSSFQDIRRLIIRHCYKLQDIPLMFRARAKIEVVDCNPLAVTVKEPVRVRAIIPYYSWIENLKS
ncbi:putative late blight resistance protein homolog r1a-6 [Phtheirospermum japonicum]|uniref:Putative late blight resistance protein homolog r1a-6 n=1 Tax=Phtheirospermum japonicum TaxID=374723 RepID=A0A830AYH7_9LAMI|nr:putative late blight resistance protein homolog r1a-6 [Phtheirospermum japonicum]